MKRLFISLVLLISVFTLHAQDKQFTLDDVISGGKNFYSFYPKSISNLKWIEGSDAYSYTDNDQLLVVNAKSGKEKVAFTLDQFNAILPDSVRRIPAHAWLSADRMLLHLRNEKCVLNIRTKKIESSIHYPAEAQNVELDATNDKIAYTIDNNLFIATPEYAKIAVTNDTNSDIKNGQTYHRNEFGISGGIFWSPKGNLLAFARKDESMVEVYPIVNVETREASLENIKYPMAGMTSHEVTIGVYNPKTSETIFLQTGAPKDQYLTNIAWSPDETIVYIAVLNREQNHMKLNAYNATSGEFIQTLFEETDEQYVEPENPIVFVPNKDQFIWQSERSGHNHLYLYDTNGNLIKPLTEGNWDVTRFQSFDTAGENIFYTSTENGQIERHTFRLNLESNKRTVLTKQEGTHYSFVASSGNFLIDYWSNTETPRTIDLVNVAKQTTKTLKAGENTYADYQLGETKIFTIKAADDSTDLYCRMITPPNYDPNKKYPVIVYVYGGPHAQLVTNSWMGGARMWQHYMAQQGYIAFTLDNRGSGGRGQAFEEVIHRHLGENEMADQMRGIDYLLSLPYVDANRIGVHGWSFGGFMTTSLMTHYPETFKVGVAGGPVIDWKYYEIMYGERYMDTPEENPEGYAASSLLNKVENLEGRLLIIHGAIDPTVVWQNSLMFVRECVKHRVQVDYFTYPRHEHNVIGPDRVHLMEKVSRYFEDFL